MPIREMTIRREIGGKPVCKETVDDNGVVTKIEEITELWLGVSVTGAGIFKY
jgi:hypothetical protein